MIYSKYTKTTGHADVSVEFWDVSLTHVTLLEGQREDRPDVLTQNP